MTPEWTKEEDDTLLQMAGKASYVEIAVKLGIRTRSAVAGRLRRLRAKDAPEPVYVRPVAVPSGCKQIHLQHIKSNQCHWPIEGMIYCGEPSTRLYGYCEYHLKKYRRQG